MHDLYNTKVMQRRNRRGGVLMPGAVSMSVFVPHGEVCGALPSGRKAGEPLANGVGAVIGAETNGLLADFNSMGKIDFTLDPAVIWNVRIDGDPLAFTALIRLTPLSVYRLQTSEGRGSLR